MLQRKLMRREASERPIRVGWVGAGRMITGAICQTAQMRGMRNAVICDLRVEAALRAYKLNGIRGNQTGGSSVVSRDVGGGMTREAGRGEGFTTQNEG